MSYTATYSPDDNKLRLYSLGRLPADVYARVKAAGFRWAPKQDLFVAPMWTPQRADLLLELCGEIGDDDSSLTERAEERAERFEEYHEHRSADAESARKAVSAIADNIPFGQPILVGHHSERHARKDAERIENGMRKAVKMWETAQYWTGRAAGAIRHAKYKERPDVRARRIKGIEADLRKIERSDKESIAGLRMLDLIDTPDKWKPSEDGSILTREERAAYIAGRMNANVSRRNSTGSYWSMYDVLRLPAEERYKEAPQMTVDEVLADVRASFERATAYRLRWSAHYQNRLAYERAMLADSGGTVADKSGPEIGGACKCWASPRNGWSYIKKVNKVSVTVLDNWGNGGGNFTRTIPFDKLAGIMTSAQVQDARDTGQLVHIDDTGFQLRNAPLPKPSAPATPDAATFDAMKESLRAGVQVVTAPQLFPTPRELAERMVQLAGIEPGHRVLEPSAGTGALLGAMGGSMFGHNPERGTVHAVEINRQLAGRLQAEFPLTEVHAEDFMAYRPDDLPFDRILMNPPFADGADIKHIRHALTLLKPGGRLVAICANGPRQRDALQPLADQWIDLDQGTFKISGTGVNTALLVIDLKQLPDHNYTHGVACV